MVFNKSKNGIRPLYTSYHDTDKHKTKRQEQLRKDRFAWKVGIFAMTIISIVGFYAIYWASTL